ncbi:DUF6434 domain-containing protein [Acetanaerobacterium elongatum]|uniref:DUF6434 domain-containing protein n=1 Tax=Acetanaerobacterium elongatum TaxID=258515 RepID=A0A1G9XQF4_9FIRM|nr:DUF6434 domain-containing protein [Acetanaerobacterium elongatum]SDM99007.1 hypothetical protein SAMN05192585_10914 [Acetanaerobacterium elongatum]
MTDRPALTVTLDSDTFKAFYYLKEELTAFCRQEGLQATGSKAALTQRICVYLSAGKKESAKAEKRYAADIGELTAESIIEPNIVCSEKHRAFFKRELGRQFSFNVLFQNWLKENAGKTYGDALEAYRKILADKKANPTKIDKQFEYNTYIRDFFSDNQGKTLQDAIRCWNYKKALPGHHRYERTDLAALYEEVSL